MVYSSFTPELSPFIAMLSHSQSPQNLKLVYITTLSFVLICVRTYSWLANQAEVSTHVEKWPTSLKYSVYHGHCQYVLKKVRRMDVNVENQWSSLKRAAIAFF